MDFGSAKIVKKLSNASSALPISEENDQVNPLDDLDEKRIKIDIQPLE